MRQWDEHDGALECAEIIGHLQAIYRLILEAEEKANRSASHVVNKTDEQEEFCAAVEKCMKSNHEVLALLIQEGHKVIERP